MNVLDENITESQRAWLRSKRVAVRQIGEEVGRKGMKDGEIISLLHQLDRPTFFTLDADFHDGRLCHQGYCLVQLDVEDESVANFIRRVLRHRELNTKSKRMGCVVRVSPSGLKRWRIHQKDEENLGWK